VQRSLKKISWVPGAAVLLALPGRYFETAAPVTGGKEFVTRALSHREHAKGSEDTVRKLILILLAYTCSVSHIQAQTTSPPRISIQAQIAASPQPLLQAETISPSQTPLRPQRTPEPEKSSGAFLGITAAVAIPAIVSMIVLLVTNLVVLFKIHADAKATLRRELTSARILRLRTALEKFYDPVHALTQLNTAMIITFGRSTFPTDVHFKKEAELLWDSIVETSILPTNQRLASIIQENVHLICKEDNLDIYMVLLKHIQSYAIFRKQRNEIHKKHTFPKEFDKHVSSMRSAVLQELESQESQIGHYLKPYG
jgi:hypothetical protein